MGLCSPREAHNNGFKKKKHVTFTTARDRILPASAISIAISEVGRIMITQHYYKAAECMHKWASQKWLLFDAVPSSESVPVPWPCTHSVPG